MDEYSKSIRRVLRELRDIAHEREISQHIEKLWEKFQEWKSGKIQVWDLTEVIHEFDYRTARQLYLYYNGNKPDITVCDAINAGLLKEDEVPSKVLDVIKWKLEKYRKLKESE